MIWDNLGLPKINGASDWQDSAFFAGMLVTFNWPQAIALDQYIIERGKYVRHPNEYVYTFSRDQTIPLFSGLKTMGFSRLVEANYKTEGDFVDPGVRGHIRRCAGKTATRFQDWFLWTSILWHIHFNADHESNQILCMCWMHPDEKYLRYFCKNFDWKKSIVDYYCNWRNEPDFAAHMIDTISARLAK